jgi:hypothetical protein
MPAVETLTVLEREWPFESLNVSVHVPAFCGVTVTVKDEPEADVGEIDATGLLPEEQLLAIDTEPELSLSVTEIVPA